MRHLIACFLLLISASAAAQYEWQDIDRVVAMGDLHGDYEQYIELLEINGLVNARLAWTGGETHLVQLGDIPDRGPDSLKIMRHMMKLEKQAARKGGRVHPLVGNHEAMNIEGDLRYVHPGEYEVLVTRGSNRLQEAYVERVFDYFRQQPLATPKSDETLRSELMAQYPPGFVEHRRLWEPGGEIARWVAKHNAVIKIDRTLFVHGGINPHLPHMPIAEINNRIANELTNPVPLDQESFAASPDSPLWYRGLAMNDAETELAPLVAMLAAYDADRIVIAHTPTGGRIKTRLDNRVIMIDMGIAAYYGSHLGNIVIERGVFFEVSRDATTVLPLEP
ncbi:MAG: metallophosphoesterase [Pseudomonadota bacterium]